MYPNRELARLAERKLLLQARITVRRLECVIAAQPLAQPLRVADHFVAGWREIFPLVKAIAIPLGVFAANWFSKSGDKNRDGGGTGKGRLSALLAALPMLLEIWKNFREMRQRSATQTSG
jgi:hypothetical protein